MPGGVPDRDRSACEIPSSGNRSSPSAPTTVSRSRTYAPKACTNRRRRPSRRGRNLFVVADQRVVLRQRLPPVTPHRAAPVVVMSTSSTPSRAAVRCRWSRRRVERRRAWSSGATPGWRGSSSAGRPSGRTTAPTSRRPSPGVIASALGPIPSSSSNARERGSLSECPGASLSSMRCMTPRWAASSDGSRARMSSCLPSRRRSRCRRPAVGEC